MLLIGSISIFASEIYSVRRSQHLSTNGTMSRFSENIVKHFIREFHRRTSRNGVFPVVLGILITLAITVTGCGNFGAGKGRVLILVVDGLRPDYVTEDIMPRLNALAESGVRGLAHHAVVPTVTRVNGPSIFTGHYPSGHGMMGNSVYLADVDPDRTLDASDADDLRMIDEVTGGRLLTKPSLGELLDEQDLVFFAASSGSAGAGMLMNHRGAGVGLVHYEFTIPESLGSIVTGELGPLPEPRPDGSSIGLVARAVDALLRIGLDFGNADVLALWLTEPDKAAHATGIGSPTTLAVLRSLDEEIGRLLDGLAERGVLETTNILVTSDHGFTTRTGTSSLSNLLVEEGLKEASTSMDVVVAGGAIHVLEGGAERIADIVHVLQRTDWIGPVFTSADPDDANLGHLPGTLAYAAIGWNHQRASDIFTTQNWSSAVNEYGYAGEVLAPGIAGHGSTSPWDIRVAFIASGPDIKRGVVSNVPTGNIDLTPTALHLMGVPIQGGFDGRVLSEIFGEGPDPATIDVQFDPVHAEVVLPDLSYQLTVERTRVGGSIYVDGTQVERIR